MRPHVGVIAGSDDEIRRRRHRHGWVDDKRYSRPRGRSSRVNVTMSSRIEKRIELWSRAEAHGEPFQVLRYQHGQEYKAHFDYFFTNRGCEIIESPRCCSISPTWRREETVFPNRMAPTNRDASKFSECGNLGRGIKARKGDALLFWSMKPGGELDREARMRGVPSSRVKNGRRRSGCTSTRSALRGKSVHKIFYDGGPLPTPGCNDANEACAGWAQSGECDKNPGFMHKSCTMSCRLCRGHWRGSASQASPSPTTNEN